MSNRRNPRRVEINGYWYDAREGWAGTLEFYAFEKPKYTAKEPFMHITNLFYVYDSNGNKVGEFHTDHRDYSGCVTGLEV